MFLLVTEEGRIVNGTFLSKKKRENGKISLFCYIKKNSVTEVMFVGGIGSHLKVSQVDQSVCLGNELNNLSARKDFLLKNIKSSHPTQQPTRCLEKMHNLY